MPPTGSTTAAQRSFSIGRFDSAEVSSRERISLAPSSRSQSASSGLPVAAATSNPRAARMPTAVEPTPPEAPSTSTGPVAGLDAVVLEPLHRQPGGEAGGAERHRLARAQPVGQRDDPVAGHPRVLGEAAVVGDAEVVAVDDDLFALAVARHDGAGQVDAGDQRRDLRDLALRRDRERVLVVDARPVDADDDVALAEVVPAQLAQLARDVVVALLRHQRAEGIRYRRAAPTRAPRQRPDRARTPPPAPSARARRQLAAPPPPPASSGAG